MSNNNTNDNEFFSDLSDSLGQQVEEIENKEDDAEDIEESPETYDTEYGDEDFEEVESEEEEMSTPGKKSRKVLMIFGIVIGVLMLFALWIGFTSSGRRFGFGIVAKFIHGNMATEDEDTDLTAYVDNGEIDENEKNDSLNPDNPGAGENETVKGPRSEDYVKTYLIFGIEEIYGASNTDAMMLVSINSNDKTIKLTSLLRDTYVEIPGWNPNKLNSVYAKGAHGSETVAEAKKNGAAKLIEVIENTYDIDISGYASVNFSSFENVVNRLGGIDIELGEKEAAYLNKTNYISEPSNRCVKAGWNHLNGNQAMGYVRVRKVVTLGGANNDYGRTVRQRRVINAIISKYKSSDLLDLIPIMKDCLGYVYTNLTEDQIQEVLFDVVDNGIFDTASLRLPADELFRDSGKAGIYNGSSNITYALVIDGHREDNIKKLHQFVFNDPVEDSTDNAANAGTVTTTP